jgi:hypothetical protein
LSRVYGEKDAGGIITVEDCKGPVFPLPRRERGRKARVEKRVSKRRGNHEDK